MEYDYDAYHAAVDFIEDEEVVYTREFYTYYAARLHVKRLADRSPEIEVKARDYDSERTYSTSEALSRRR